MDECSLCKKQLPDDGRSETWTTDDGESVVIGRSAEASAVADTSLGELTICEQCFNALPDYLDSTDLYEIHYQFGLEYRDRKMTKRSAAALRKALSFLKTPDALAALAHAEDRMGNHEAAVSLYEQALQIDSDHFMSKENLKHMKGSQPANS